MLSRIKRFLKNCVPSEKLPDEGEILLANAPAEFREAIAFLRPQDQIMAVRQMLYPLGLIELNIDQVHYMENPFHDYNHVFLDEQGRMNLSIVNGPIHQALQILQDEGEEELRRRYPETNYGQLIKIVQNEEFSPINYYGRLEKLISIYRSIETQGYLGPPSEQAYILVTEKPIEVSRMGYRINWRRYTVHSGHHRASVLAALGYKSFKAVLLKDLLDRESLELVDKPV